MRRIAFLAVNTWGNDLGTPYLFASALRERFDVQIWGAASSERGLWPPLKTLEIPCHTLENLHALEADLLYAFNATPSSFGLALELSASRRIPLLLHFDDWESAAYWGLPLSRKLQWGYLREHFRLRRWERLAGRADGISCASSWVQRRVGGVRIAPGCDTMVVDPARYDRGAARRALSLERDARYVLFQGSFRRHKGIEDLIAAFWSAGEPSWRLLIVGGTDDQEFWSELKAAAGKNPRIVWRGYSDLSMFQDCASLRYLAAADLVVIPQRDTPYARSQMPAKLFTAMSMAKPVISTAVADIPEVLAGCGIVVPPRRPDRLAEEMKALLGNAERARQLGLRARRRCVEHYGFEPMRRALLSLIDAATEPCEHAV